MKNMKGQILPLALMMVLVMASLWVLLIRTGKLLTDRIQLQIAADTAVQSACAVRARGLNSIGLLNKWLGVPVLGIGWPQACWWTAPQHPLDRRVIGQKLDDIKSGVKAARTLLNKGYQKGLMNAVLIGSLSGLTSLLGISYDLHPKQQEDWAAKQRMFIHRVIDLQERYLKTYGGGRANAIAREVAKAQGADGIYVPSETYSLGLQRNTGALWYFPTLHLWLKNTKLPIPLPSPPDPQDEKLVKDNAKRWYEQRPDFYRKSMRLYVYKKQTTPFKGTFPYLYAVSAARVYNTKGPMFPTPRQTHGLRGGQAAMRLYDKSDERWQTQLVPVGKPYVH